ncbi:hypothetical protein ACUH96_00825 [Dermabacteraceae bacterium P13077]
MTELTIADFTRWAEERRALTSTEWAEWAKDYDKRAKNCTAWAADYIKRAKNAPEYAAQWVRRAEDCMRRAKFWGKEARYWARVAKRCTERAVMERSWDEWL